HVPMSRVAVWWDACTRRTWLHIGVLGLPARTLPAQTAPRRAQAASAVRRTGRARSCIVLFYLGGPPQHETWDPKPDAPGEIRGSLKPIASNVPGLMVGELMPRTARLMDKVCVLRAMATDDNAHSSSGYWMLTGVPHQPLNAENAKPGAPNDWPSVAAIVQRLRPGVGLPATVRLPEHIWNTGGIVWPGQEGGFLGRGADPWLIHCDPNAVNFEVPGVALPVEVPAPRLGERLSLLEKVNRSLDSAERSGTVARYDVQSRQAFDLLRA